MKSLLKSTFAVALLTASLAAQAAPINVVFTDVPGPLDGGLVTKSFISSGSGSATLAFDLVGYATVDGVNCCTDIFNLSYNGALVLSAAFNMGGGGTNTIFSIAPGVTVISSVVNPGGGGLTKISFDHSIVNGLNKYEFDYGFMQGLGDEGWGLINTTLTGRTVDESVPEPESMALLGLALTGLGLARRRK